MLRLILLSTLFMSYVLGQEVKTGSRDKTKCINELTEWCDGLQHSDQGVPFISESPQSARGYYRVLCESDSRGTNCSRNASPWFTCASDHLLAYYGKGMTNTTADVDDICEAADMTTKIFTRKIPNGDTYSKGFQGFFGLPQKLYSMISDFLPGFSDESLVSNPYRN